MQTELEQTFTDALFSRWIRKDPYSTNGGRSLRRGDLVFKTYNNKEDFDKDKDRSVEESS